MKAAREAGLSDDEIRLAVQEAEALRVEAARSMADYAHGLLGDGEARAQRVADPDDRLCALVQIGAATGGNAGHVLDRLLPLACGLGLSNDALQEAVEMAGAVKKMASTVFDRDVERALERQADVATGADGCACGDSAQVAAGEATQRSPGSCC